MVTDGTAFSGLCGIMVGMDRMSPMSWVLTEMRFCTFLSPALIRPPCLHCLINPITAFAFFRVSPYRGLTLNSRRLKIAWSRISGALLPTLVPAVYAKGKLAETVYLPAFVPINNRPESTNLPVCESRRAARAGMDPCRQSPATGWHGAALSVSIPLTVL
ncbi:hypothetical protein MVEN_01729600 [Mycena venus]|uniref:Uncharacterized protein n=1 Tax=Mycena venus TaxID=2733690 RepID=A0A8H6XMH9_9AGAR|nr:hypothetical protein MVEN_01729600 [Mycena venus]